MKNETIKSVRIDLGLNQTDFAKKIGLSAKSQVSELEQGKYNPSVSVALAIEKLSDGRIDAADLNADVRAARAGVYDCAIDGGAGDVSVHGDSDSDDAVSGATRQSDDMSQDAMAQEDIAQTGGGQ